MAQITLERARRMIYDPGFKAQVEAALMVSATAAMDCQMKGFSQSQGPSSGVKSVFQKFVGNPLGYAEAVGRMIAPYVEEHDLQTDGLMSDKLVQKKVDEAFRMMAKADEAKR